MKLLRVALVAIIFAMSATLVAGSALAFGPKVTAQTSWKDKQEAKKAYKKGKVAMSKGDYKTALEAFQKADQLHPGAAPKYQIAVCYDRLNQIPEAIGAYQTFISSNPSQKYADRVISAGKRIAELETMLKSTITLDITPGNLGGMVVKIDGQEVQGTEHELPAGDHNVEVTAPNHEPVSIMVTVQAGVPQAVPIQMVVKPPPVPITDPDTGESDPGLGLKIAGFAVAGAGVVGLAVMGVFGGMALGSQSDYEAGPTEELADDTENQALLADVFLGVGGGLVIVGGVLLYLGFTAEGEDEAIASGVPEIMPYAGPDGAGAAATWTF